MATTSQDTLQRLAVSALISECEKIVGTGALDEQTEMKLRRLIAATCRSFNMPSIAERPRLTLVSA